MMNILFSINPNGEFDKARKTVFWLRGRHLFLLPTKPVMPVNIRNNSFRAYLYT